MCKGFPRNRMRSAPRPPKAGEIVFGRNRLNVVSGMSVNYKSIPTLPHPYHPSPNPVTHPARVGVDAILGSEMHSRSM